MLNLPTCGLINPFTPTDRFRSIQNNDWKCPLKLFSVEGVNLTYQLDIGHIVETAQAAVHLSDVSLLNFQFLDPQL